MFKRACDSFLEKQTSLVAVSRVKRKKCLKKMCFMNEHRINRGRDVIPIKWLSNESHLDTLNYIFSRLPGIKTAVLSYHDPRVISCLNIHCPQLECLSVSGGTYSILIQMPTLVHLKGEIDGILLNHLPHYFAKLKALKTKGFREILSHVLPVGMKALHLKSSSYNLLFDDTDWKSLFLSSAMSTVESLSLATSNSLDMDFEAPKLKDLTVRTGVRHEYTFSILWIVLQNSLKRSPELQSFQLDAYKMCQPWKMPFPFTLRNLVSLSVPVGIKNADDVLYTMSGNETLENLTIGMVCGNKKSKRKKMLNDISSMSKLKCLTIDNRYLINNIDDENYEKGLTRRDLNHFVNCNTINGKLRFSFTLHQLENHPMGKGYVTPIKTVWRGIDWWDTIDYFQCHHLHDFDSSF